jgi:integrase
VAIRAGAAEQNPCVFWEYEAGKPRTRYPLDEELEAFKIFCRTRFKDELTLLYVDLKRLIGLRVNNMLGITRRMIEDDGLRPGTSKRGRKQIFVYHDGQGRSTGLHEALDVILALPRPAKSIYLFCRRNAKPFTVEGFQSNWQRRMNAYVDETGAERFWEHDIRAAAGTAVDEAGQDAKSDAQSLLGHAQVGTTNRYLSGRAAVKVLPAPRPKR